MSIEKVRYTHDGLIDHIIRAQLAGVRVTNRELAKNFGVTESWMSRILSSDAFKERLAKRRSELVDPAILQTIEEGFEELVRLAQAKLREELEKPHPEIRAIEKALEIGSRHLTDARRNEIAADRSGTPLEDRIEAIKHKLNSLFSPQFQQRIQDAKVIDIAPSGAETGASPADPSSAVPTQDPPLIPGPQAGQ